MPRFFYKGRRQGKLEEGVMDAPTPAVVASRLSANGVTPIQIVPAQDVPAYTKRRLWGSKKISREELMMFSNQMYTLMHAGVPIIRAIRGLADNTQQAYFSLVLREIADNLESGRTLTDALRQYPKIFSTLLVSLIHVGENTGQLDDAFKQSYTYLELEEQNQKRVKAASRYPKIVLTAIVIAMVVINIFVIPTFAKIFADAHTELPWATKILIGTSAFFVNYWPHLLVAAVGMVFLIRQYVRTPAGRFQWHWLQLRLPVFGPIVEQAMLARFVRNFSMMLRAGIPVIQALLILEKSIDNQYIAGRVQYMREQTERGESLTNAARMTKLFTPLIIQMLAVGEETGAIEQLLIQVAEFYEREVDFRLRRLSENIEPILIVMIGGVVLVLALGIFLPLWELSTAVGH